MTSLNRDSKTWPVILAAAVIVILAGSLGARLIGRDGSVVVPDAPDATIPAPTEFYVADLEVPCWTCPSNTDWSLRFQTDLDLLAPLGTGTANAAEWFGLFAKDVGPRKDDATAAMERRIEGPEWLGQILPADDPLLLEAEPWCDQATMTYYPDIFELDGYATRITNLLLPLNMVRSWVARGLSAESTEKALEDFRRSIRLGRLLRQEDVVVISDLVGLACIHLATRGVYERALADGDLELALLASVVLGEVAPQRLGTKKHLTSTDLIDSFFRDDQGEIVLRLKSDKFDAIVETAESASDRRMRCEALIGLNIILNLGEPEESARAFEVLSEIAGDADPKVADGARWSLENPIDMEVMERVGLVNPKKM
ncbi:MAG: hypothetical protein IFK93_06495 [Acidobacteria bacterium]|uniref:Uncharacterized protein n=1 Tax=Candidatus Sulfomarinibacter kjeldsenii TaxID=2885994 RepID=A0A8J7CEX1_9BACT|nr:hypothetical protein [Candidatus Sulfomarinibacter kjeldsenii]MBD3857736.1 hypothetical protein [Candidatus Sulfomarinibacter kjeldsenii]MBD3870917.1 hypothetical protein [Candidatus Sulfomarinibacter kjeldsenii]